MVKIIYEDLSLLVIDKPPGLVVDKSETQAGPTVENWLESQAPGFLPANLERAGIVHRLDKDTSGVLLVAKTKQALKNLQAQFKSRVIKKQYLSLVHGLINEPGSVEGAIARNPRSKEKFTVIRSGREAETEYSPVGNFQFSSERWRIIFKALNEQSSSLNKIQMRKLERMNYNQFSLLLCKPKTGRTHQIRVHLKYIGYPITSDEKYVGRKMYRLDKRWCPRMFLHAAKIGFYHPVSGEWMEVESPLPEDLKNTLRLFK